MSVAFYDPTTLPPPTFEAVESVAAMIAALDTSAGVVKPVATAAADWPYLQAATDVHAHTYPATLAEKAVVVMERDDLGGRRRRADGAEVVPVRVVVTVDQEVDNYPTLLAAMHARIYAGLENETPALTRSTAIRPLQLSIPARRPVFDYERDRWASYAEYLVTLFAS